MAPEWPLGGEPPSDQEHRQPRNTHLVVEAAEIWEFICDSTEPLPHEAPASSLPSVLPNVPFSVCL